ncbi:hypothetical protein JHK87_016023 [Glycine soja]|nr:hypothetical protein JHK87_016023 [Glycine soja]
MEAHMFWWLYRNPYRVDNPSKPRPIILWLQGGPEHRDGTWPSHPTMFDAGGSNLTKDASVESVTVTVSVTDWKVVVCYVVLLMNAILV